MTLEDTLRPWGLEWPSVSAPVGSYVPARRCGDVIYTSGQLPMLNGQLTGVGKVPQDVTVERAQQAARVAVLNGLAAVAEAAGGLERVARIVRLCVFVNSSPGFTAQPQVANGASDLLVSILGENGKHARSAVGVAELPLNACLELEIIARVKT